MWVRFVYFICLVTMPLNLFAKEIVLKDFIERYLSQSSELRSAYEDLRTAKAKQLQAEAQDDLMLGASTGYEWGKNKLGETDYTHNQFSLTSQLSKHFAYTGTQVDIGASVFAYDNEAAPNSHASGMMTISVLQPVLQNFFGILDRLPIKQAALSVSAQELIYEEKLEEELQNAVDLYLSWAKAYQNIELWEGSMKRTGLIYKEIVEKFNAGIAISSDLEEGKQATIRSRQSYLQNQMEYNSAFYRIKRYWRDLSLTDTPNLDILKTKVETESIHTNPKYIRSIRQLNYMLESSELGLSGARNYYLPTLNVLAEYNQSFGDSSASMPLQDTFSIGLQFSMPIFQMQNRGREQEYFANYQKVLVQRDDAILTLENQIENMKKQILISYDILYQQEIMVESLNKKYASLEKQYKTGLIPLANLVTAETDFETAKVNLTNTQVDLQNLYHSYLSITDHLKDMYIEQIPANLSDYVLQK